MSEGDKRDLNEQSPNTLDTHHVYSRGQGRLQKYKTVGGGQRKTFLITQQIQ